MIIKNDYNNNNWYSTTSTSGVKQRLGLLVSFCLLHSSVVILIFLPSCQGFIRSSTSSHNKLLKHHYYFDFNHDVLKTKAIHKHYSLLFASSSSSSSSLPFFTDLQPLFPTHQPPPKTSRYNVTILSQDPLVYTISNLLSPDECQAFINRVSDLKGIREMKLSNPPEVSLDISKLWPLPFLSLLAGVPPIVRLLFSDNVDETLKIISLNDILQASLPPILIALSASLLLAFGIILPIIRNVSKTSSRTSQAMAFNLDEDIDFVSTLVNRICSITNHPWYGWEAPVVTRYDPGAIFARHADASPNRGKEWTTQGGQRVITCICYLNTVLHGGSTYFDKLDISVQPIQGSCLVFFPTVSGNSLNADDRMTHESIIVGNGDDKEGEEKWIVQMFGRVGPRVPPPLGLPDSYHEVVSKN